MIDKLFYLIINLCRKNEYHIKNINRKLVKKKNETTTIKNYFIKLVEICGTHKQYKLDLIDRL